MASYTTNYYEMTSFQGYSKEEILNFFKQYNLNDYLLPSQIETIEEAGMWSPDKLANKIYDTYFMREIGQETPALHSLQMKSLMNRLMEKYLPLIYTASLEYDLLVNEDYTENYTRQINGTSSQTGNTSGSSNSTSGSSGSSLSVNSTTPEGQISKEAILQGAYASSTSANENETSVTSGTLTSSNASNSGSSNSTESLTRHVKGNHGISSTYQALIKQYRENVFAFDDEIIQKLNILYMGIY